MGSVRRGGMKSRALILDFFLELLALGPINWESLGASFRLPCVGPSLP